MVTTEGENSVTLRGNAATRGGKPDLIALRDDLAVIIDPKTRKPGPSHAVQVMLYQYAVPIAMEQFKGLTISGQVAYPDHVVDVPANAVDKEFVSRLGVLVNRLASQIPPSKAHSFSECRFCEITKADCPDRIDERGTWEGTTDDF